MAVVNVAAIANSLNKRFDNELVSAVNRATVLPQVLPVRQANGPVIQWVPKFGTASDPSTQALAEGADVTVFNSDSKATASLDYVTYHEAFHVTNLAAAKAAAAGNPSQLAALYAEELEETLPRLAHGCVSEIYNGPGTGARLLGLLATAGGLRAAGTYAGINRATFAQWSGNENANGGTRRMIDIKMMRRLKTNIYVACGMEPDVIVTDPITLEYYAEILGDKRQYIEDITIRGRNVVLDGGYKALSFDGIPVLKDAVCPAGTMLMLNSRYVDLWQLPPASDSLARTGENMVDLAGTEEDQFGRTNTKLRARVHTLPAAGDYEKLALFLYFQVRVRRPNACGVLLDLLAS